MDVATALPKVPARNLGRIPLEVFGRVWEEAERRNDAGRNDAGGPMDYYLVGVVRTLRWLAERRIETPVTRVASSPLPEIWLDEYMAALAAARSPVLHPSQVGIACGTVATLGWMYHGQPEPAYSRTSTRSSTAPRT
jgi:hypothetical protein